MLFHCHRLCLHLLAERAAGLIRTSRELSLPSLSALSCFVPEFLVIGGCEGGVSMRGLLSSQLLLDVCKAELHPLVKLSGTNKRKFPIIEAYTCLSPCLD